VYVFTRRLFVVCCGSNGWMESHTATSKEGTVLVIQYQVLKFAPVRTPKTYDVAQAWHRVAIMYSYVYGATGGVRSTCTYLLVRRETLLDVLPCPFVSTQV
jgi:hypothetical protein